MTYKEAREKWAKEKEALLKELVDLPRDAKIGFIKAARDYRSGPDACSAMYMGSLAIATLWRALNGRGTWEETLSAATDEQLNMGLDTCAGIISYMRIHPHKSNRGRDLNPELPWICHDGVKAPDIFDRAPIDLMLRNGETIFHTSLSAWKHQMPKVWNWKGKETSPNDVLWWRESMSVLTADEKLKTAVEALAWYEEQIASLKRHMSGGFPNLTAVEAIITVLSLDGGTRARNAMNPEEAQRRDPTV